MPEEGKLALLDHELCHCGTSKNAKGEPVYYLRRHDLEEFEEVVRRHGLWRAGVVNFVNASLEKEQMPLFESDEHRKRALKVLKDQELLKTWRQARQTNELLEKERAG